MPKFWILIIAAASVVAILALAYFARFMKTSTPARGEPNPAPRAEDRAADAPANQAHENWDFYLCRVDDAAASITLDLALRASIPQATEDTLYALLVKMHAPDEHGLGTPEESDALNPIEDDIIEAVRSAGMRPIGRLRNHGVWQITFMGSPDQEHHLQQAAASTLASSGRSFEIVSRPDATWSYYTDFLYPDAERQRWMHDRRVVDALLSHGDPLTARRRVEHWVYFPNAPTRAAFAAAARDLGFEVIELEPTKEVIGPGVRLHRVDSVELEAIHEVTMLLTSLAAEHRGEYDGWETSVEKPD